MEKGSINELKEKILSEARRKAEEIIKEAERKAREIIERAEIEWKEKFEAEKKKIIEEYKKQASALISEAKIKYTLAKSRARNNVIETVFTKAIEKLRKRDFDTRKSLEKLLKEAIYYLPKGTQHIIIIVNPKDTQLIEEIAKKELESIKCEYTIKPSDDILGGLIIETPEGIRIDNSYETRLSRVKELLIDKISEILWGS